jgi:hypothetical protein
MLSIKFPELKTRSYSFSSHFSLLTSHFSLLTSHFSLLTSHFSLLTFTPFTVRKINFGGMPEPKITLDRNYKIQLRTHSWKINRMFLKKYSLK